MLEAGSNWGEAMQRSSGSELGSVPVLLHIIGIIKWSQSSTVLSARLPTYNFRSQG